MVPKLWDVCANVVCNIFNYSYYFTLFNIIRDIQDILNNIIDISL